MESEGKAGYLLSVFGRKLEQSSIAGILRSGKGESQYGVFELHVGHFPGRRGSA